MVDFDAAVAAVQDPNADPVFLAKIAYENPEFGANVVANPRAYPGLKRWVAEFGDEREVESDVVLSYHLETGRMNLILELLPGHAVDMAEIVDRLAVYELGQLHDRAESQQAGRELHRRIGIRGGQDQIAPGFEA